MKKITVSSILPLLLFSQTLWSQTKGIKLELNYKGYYLLKTKFRGDNEALDGNNIQSNIMKGSTFMSSQKGAPDTQQWKFQHLGGGYYKIFNRRYGNKKVLDSNNKNSSVRNGVTYLSDDNGADTQKWFLEDLKNGYYRLTTKLKASQFSLEGNYINGSMGGNAFMNITSEVTGQMWYLIHAN
jgi:hypothetical protein